MNYYKDFKLYLEELDKSENTIKSYLETIKKFSTWVNNEKDISNLFIVAIREIKDYRNYLLERYSPATVNQRLSAIKTFYGFLFESGLIKLNPAKNVRLQRVEDNIKSQYLTRAEELKVIRQASNSNKRNYCIVMLMLKTGLRPTEVCNLMLNDIFLDEKEPTLLVKNSKQNKSRYIPIPKDAYKALNEWLEERNKSEKVYHIRSNFVFTSQRQGYLETRAVQRIVENIGKNIGIKLYCVRLRATYANSLIQQANIPLSALANLMGHSSVQTSARYLTASDKDKRKYIDTISEI
ncbi:tyrosine-type recombinase/integrase [Ornithinibacillus halophilus]|uniref:Integrase/recombinase XerC n=1 Tax=Ornithinibacillus halophilus TaxID=930117 RepID=A0A1M5G387_9BACI|nr:tyrosine-type recombinase/integrase [Ornithinibacillus halophilus]SHF98183.1 integrase/recombinase XerC [Ornithinibacillus halophilus]